MNCEVVVAYTGVCVCRGGLRFSQDQSLWYLWPSSSHTGLPVSGELQERRTFFFKVILI